MRAWKGIDRFEGRASVRTWLYSIDTNAAALDIARHRSRREFAVLTLAPDGGRIAAATGFLTADLIGAGDAASWISGAALFARFGLPADPP